MAEKLAAEIIAGFNEEGGAYKKKLKFIKWQNLIKHFLILKFNYNVKKRFKIH